MSTNPRTTQYRTTTTPTRQTPEAPQPTPADRRTATETAPRTFEPTNTGDLPPMFETEAEREQR